MSILKWGKRLIPNDHPQQMWFELIEQLTTSLYKRIMSITPDQDISQIAKECLVLRDVFPDLKVLFDISSGKTHVVHKEERLGELKINVNKEILYIEGVYYFEEMNSINNPISAKLTMTFESLITQLINPDDLNQKHEFEKAIFKLT
jgi:hypothetical protein